METKMKPIHIKLMFSAFFWGSSAIAGKMLLSTMSPSQLTFVRFFIATLILGIFLKLTQRDVIRIPLREQMKLAILGLVGVAFCYYFYFEGLRQSTAFNAGLIESTIPLITFALAVVLKVERFDIAKATGFAIAYFGVMMIITRMDYSVILNSNYNHGDVLLLLSTVCFGIYNVLLNKFRFSFDSQRIKLLYIFMYGSIALLGWLVFDGNIKDLHWNVSFKEIISITVLSLGASVLAYVFFNDGIAKIGASKASSFINFVPIVTILLALIVLGERPVFSQIIGSIVVLSGVYISQNGLGKLFPTPKAVLDNQ